MHPSQRPEDSNGPTDEQPFLSAPPMRYQNAYVWLLLLSSVFVPLYGVILGRLGGRRDVAGQIDGARIEWVAVATWFGGVALFHLLPRFAPEFGSALPTLAVTFLIARLTRR